jgi:hypothetical protein
MTLGPRQFHKCAKHADFMVYEKGYKRGGVGKMPLCAEHYAAFKKLDNRPHTIERRNESDA